MLLIGCNLLEHFEVQRTELAISHVEGTASQVMLQKVIFWTQEMLCEADSWGPPNWCLGLAPVRHLLIEDT
jgi:hypothetical protein